MNQSLAVYDPVADLSALIGPAVFLPIPAGKKGPIIPQWQRLTLQDMTPGHLATLNHGANIGILQGVASQGLCSIDCDSEDDLNDFLALNPELNSSLLTRGQRGGNVWLRITAEDYPKTQKIKNREGRPVGEWRSTGGQTVIHGTHPTGCKYTRNGLPVESYDSFSQIQWPESWILPWKTDSECLEIAPYEAPCLSDPAPDQESKSYAATDAGAMQRFVDRYAQDIRYVPSLDQFFGWEGKWSRDQNGAILRKSIQLGNEILESLKTIQGSDKKAAMERETVFSEAKRYQTRRDMTNIVELAKTSTEIQLPLSQIDKDPFLIAARNCVVNLQTGESREFTRDDFFMHELGVDSDPAAECPIWNQFMEQVIPDAHVRRFLHKAVGYTLTGSTSEQCFFFLYGTGANGKSVFVAILELILGSYGTRAGKGIIAASSRGDYPKHEMAELIGRRGAFASETDASDNFAEGIIKDITGGDTLRGERKYEDAITFRALCKLWISGNHKPRIYGTDEGIWRRVRLIPFLEQFRGEKADRNLFSKLAAEAPGILNWAIAGALLWQKEGLDTPQAIKEAVEDYRTDEDSLADFLSECTEEDRDSCTPHGDLFRKYQSFSESAGVRFKLTSKGLAKKLRERGWVDRRTESAKCVWQGVKITDQEALS